MAEEKETIIIDVQFSSEETAKKLREVQQQINKLQTENSKLKTQMKDLDRTTEEGAETYAKLSTQLAINNQQIKSLQVSEKVLQNVEKNTNVTSALVGDSFKEQARQLTLLKTAYSQLTKAERESASGKEMLKKLQELDAQVKANDASMGNFQRNVGNYPKVFDLTGTSIGKIATALQGLGGQATTAGQFFGSAITGMTQGLKTFGKAFLTPPIAVVTVIVSAFYLFLEKLKDAFKKNDDAMTALTKAFASFEPVIDWINKKFEQMVRLITVAVVAIGKLIASFSDASKEAQNLVQAEDDLQQKEREYTENSAKRSAEISELRAKAADKEKYNAKERQDMLQQAIDLEKQNLTDEKAIAAERVRILEARAEKEQNTTDETKDKIAQAKAAMYRAVENYNNGVRRLDGQRAEAAREEMRTLKRTPKSVRGCSVR